MSDPFLIVSVLVGGVVSRHWARSVWFVVVGNFVATHVGEHMVWYVDFGLVFSLLCPELSVLVGRFGAVASMFGFGWATVDYRSGDRLKKSLLSIRLLQRIAPLPPSHLLSGCSSRLGKRCRLYPLC
jgi:hypothetical protein